MTSDTSRRVTSCRVCESRAFAPVVSLGSTPLANALVDPRDCAREEPRYPLEAIRCIDCGLVQLSVVVAPEVMFRHYLYATSASVPMVNHFDAYAEEVVGRFAPPGSLVVEIGSNDGVLLGALARRGVRVVGVEPADNLAAQANAIGLETWNEFFATTVASRIASRHGNASAVLANNVFAHIDDLGGVLAGLHELIDARGVFVVEVPYLPDLLERVEYDTIYHEHLSYFALTPLVRLVQRSDFEIIDVRRLPVHGGSLRIVASRRGAHPSNASVERVLAEERAVGLTRDEPYARFAAAVARSRDTLRSLLGSSRAGGKRVAALGATAKGNTLLNYCDLGPDDVHWVADSTPLKHGLLTPGTRIPIRPEDTIVEERPDFTLLLAWNYADAIVKRFAPYTALGGRFIHPIPLARVLEP